MNRYKDLLILVVLILFSAFWVIRHFDIVGDDLSSSYLGCKMIATHQETHLYSHDPVNFDLVGDPVWKTEADRDDYQGTSHPYVQTPLWAYSLLPLCEHTTYPTFNRFFLVVAMVCFSGMIWVITRYWVPRFYAPLWIGLICVALFTVEPFRYAILLVQTHIIFVLLGIMALTFARRNPILAGLLLALAAVVKITPGFLVIYWVLTRQWKAAFSFVGWSVLLALITVVATGPGLMLAFLHEISQTSNVLLVAWNNQSLAGWWMGRYYPQPELHEWYIHPLPPLVKITSLTISVALTALGGFLDGKLPERPSYGAALALVAATVFAPIAWSHYYFLLLLPVLLMIDSYLRRPSWALLGLTAMIFGLNLDKDLFRGALHLQAILPTYSQFYAGLLAIAAMVFLRLRQPAADLRI
jgi:hypothetical protein